MPPFGPPVKFYKHQESENNIKNTKFIELKMISYFTQVSHESIVPIKHVLFSNAALMFGTFSLSHKIFRAEKYGEIGKPEMHL